MKERTKETIKDGFGSLISNAAALRGAKNGPLWLTIVMFVLAVLLPALPIFITKATTKGSYFLNSYSYGLERYVTSVALDLKDTRHAEFSISEDHLLSVRENDVEVTYVNYGTNKPYASYENATTHQYDFLVYLSDATNGDDKNTVINGITSIYYQLGTTTAVAAGDNTYHPNYMILFKNGVFVRIYGNNGIEPIASSYSGDFKTIKANDKCLETLLTVKDQKGNIIEQNLYSSAYIDGVYKNFKTFIDRSYDTLRVQDTWIMTGVYTAVFFGINVIMGFLMWLLTRGKNNPNNYFSPWLTMKVQARLGLAPAIIAAIVGIWLTNMVPVIYIMMIGLRVMWISMKELRPIQN